MEAFSDGVLAIIITIMVLELKTPEGVSFADLRATWPTFLSYMLSFFYVGMYWNNHHHLLQAARRVNGAVLWANLHLLFWLSLFPYTTAWMGEHRFARVPVIVYGVVVTLAAIAYKLLQTALVREQGDEELAAALGSDLKGKLSPVIYVASIGLALVSPWLSLIGYSVVAVLWVIPDRRLSNLLSQRAESAS